MQNEKNKINKRETNHKQRKLQMYNKTEIEIQ